MFRRFGSEVTVVVRGKQLLGREDTDVSDGVGEILREDGVTILMETDTLRAGQDNGKPNLVIRDKDGERTLSGSHLLVATGRTPNTDRLGLDKAGVEMEKGFVKVDDKLQTNVPHIYALGDVNGGPAFTHISYDDYRIIRTNLLQGGSASTKDRFTVYTVFIDPQLGRVGITEEEAKKQGRKVRVAKMPMNYIARALEVDEPRGFMKCLVDADTEQILGAAILGLEGGELMAMIEIAMLGKLSYKVLKDAIFAHPTLAESLNNLFSNFQDEG
jgi:pyruvate/2-oxoglutarate dehydrogenase complex dihydrolipoamide dehydrogenase (E3) component